MRDGSMHKGIDFAMPEGTPLLALEPGTIEVYNDDPGGWGNAVIIHYDSGDSHLYAHLNGVTVSDGARVKPGDTVALSGNTGSSTGAHLHWEVWKGRDHTNAVNPVTYIRSYMTAPPVPRSNSANLPTGSGVIPVGNSSYVSAAPAGTQYNYIPPTNFTNTQPLRFRDTEARPNSPSNNYSYKVIADDRDFRLMLNQTAESLQIPGQWLADIIAHESLPTMRPDQRNLGGGTDTGLIQFTAETARSLGTTTEALARMTRAEQMAYVYKHLEPFKGRMESIFDIAVAVHRPGYFDRWKRGEDFEGKQHLEQQYFPSLGKFVGRSYYRSQANVTHTRFVASCTICQRAQAGGYILPHEVSVYG